MQTCFNGKNYLRSIRKIPLFSGSTFGNKHCHKFHQVTVELQWLEHLWDHENYFETGGVRANECESLCQARRHNRDIFSIFFNMNVYCVFSLDAPHRGDSNVYTQYTIFITKK